MEKIKYLLGFGILGVLFSSCFGMTVIRESNSLDYGNHNTSIYYNQASLTKNSNYGGNYINNGFCRYTDFFNYSLNCNGLLNSSTFLNSSLVSFSGFNTSWSCSYNGNSPSTGNSRFSIDSNHNIKYIVDDWIDNCGDDVSYHGELLFSNNGEFLGDGLDYYLSYIHLIGANYNKNPGFIQSNGKMDYYYFFGANNVYSKYGSYSDVSNGYVRRKFYDGFDFNSSSIIVSESNPSDFRFISSNPYSFSSISTSNGTQYNFGTTTYSGYLILSLGNYSDSFTVSNSLVLMLSGNNIYYNYFNTYSPYIETLANTLVQSAGVLTTSGGNAYDLFSQFVNDEGYYFEVAGSYSSNNITIRSYKTGINHTYVDYVFGFSEDSSVPVIIPPMNQGGNGGNNSGFPDPIFDGGIFDANTYLIEESIKCYITSGEVCNSPFTYAGSENYVNNYSHQPREWDSSLQSGSLTFNNSFDMLSQYCLNTNSIQYSFCSQLSLYNGYPITYYYNNGYFNYYIFGSGFTYNLGVMWSGQLGYAYCEGPNCSDINEGLPIFIKKDTGDYSEYGFSGEYVSLDFFKNYFENGFFFQCPFSYSGSYFTIGSKLIDRLDQHDPLKPINCFISAFSHGVKSSFFGDSKLGLSHTGVFLQNTGPNAIRFYTFIDIVLCLGYIFLFSKLFKFLKKH